MDQADQDSLLCNAPEPPVRAGGFVRACVPKKRGWDEEEEEEEGVVRV